VERLRSNTHRLIAVGFEQQVLGNTWWALKPQNLNRLQQEALLLWLNSSLSLLLVLGRRVITQGAWMQLKQPAWQSMPVLNVRALSPEQLATLDAQYIALSRERLESLAQLKTDAVRCRIDAAICNALGIPDPLFVRELLEREPGLTGRDIAHGDMVAQDGGEEVDDDCDQSDLF
jgi:DNA-binding Xre family transcriptional regulator